MSKEAMKLALEVLESVQQYMKTSDWYDGAITALRKALAEQPAQQQKPVAYVNDQYSRDGYNDEISVLLPVGTALYTSPPARKPLTEELKDAFFDGFTSVVTYNDTQQNSPEEAWDEYKAAHGIKP